jgi:hypothetical protein
MNACVSGKLPEMELELIFARLPLKDIVRLQALNTHWKLFIRSSFFQQHMEQAISQGGARFGVEMPLAVLFPHTLYHHIHVILKLPKLLIHGFIISCDFESIARNQ